MYVTSDPDGIDKSNLTDVFDIGIKSRLYRNLNPLIYTSKYSYVDDDTYDNEFGNVIVVPDDVIAVVSTYSTTGLTNGISSIFNNTAEADVKSTTDCDTVNDPVINAEPENGNGVVDIPVNCDPSPKYVPKDAVDDALDDMSDDAVTGPNISIESSVPFPSFISPLTSNLYA